MIGCLGGLGRSIAKWMYLRGARNFVFLGRSGASKPEAKAAVEDLQSRGAFVQVVTGSVANKDDVERMVAAAEHPIGGVVQGSMGVRVSRKRRRLVRRRC